jgi:large subunit ribosomal protein L4
MDSPRTKDAVAALEALGLRTKGERAPRVLLVLDRHERSPWLSFRNLGKRVQILIPEELNAYDVLVNDWLVFSKATLETTVAKFATEQRVPKAAERAPASGVSPEAASEAVEASE